MTDALTPDGRQVEILPGSEYTTVAIPLDYPPTRDMRPRWGGTRPLIPYFVERFQSDRQKYEQFLGIMLDESANLTDVKDEFAHERLPEVAWQGVAFEPIDAVALYTMIKHHKPRRFVEIGSGITTCWAHRAAQDGQLDTKIISIDPSPRAAINAICDTVIRDGLETMEDLTIFEEMERGDILFMDGSHRTFLNSDVTVFFIDVLPRLKPGVVVHVHDVALPWDYSEMFLNWYWSEQYMLAVYLMASRGAVDVLLPTAWISDRLTDSDFFTRNPVIIPGRAATWSGGGSMWFTKSAA